MRCNVEAFSNIGPDRSACVARSGWPNTPYAFWGSLRMNHGTSCTLQQLRLMQGGANQFISYNRKLDSYRAKSACNYNSQGMAAVYH